MYERTGMCMFVCTYVRVYVFKSVCMNVYMYVYMYVCKHVFTGARICVYACMVVSLRCPNMRVWVFMNAQVIVEILARI